MKIALVAQDFPPETGGIHSYSIALAREFSKEHDVTVVAPRHRHAPALDSGLPFCVRRYYTPHTSLFGLAAIRRLSAMIPESPNQIFFHAHYATALSSLCAKRRGQLKRYYLAAHARELLHQNVPYISAKLRSLILKEASIIFAVSRYTRDRVVDLGVLPDKVQVVPNGVDLSHFRPRPKAEARRLLRLGRGPILLSTGRLIRRKGFDTTICALSLIAPKYPDLRYLIVGHGPDKTRLQALARKMNVPSKVIFHGHVPKAELPQYYSAADVFTMPSREEKGGSVEGFGLVFLEAGACRTPVIGTTSGGIPDAIDHEINGLIVPPNNPHALARSIEKLLDNPAYRNALGQRGVQRTAGYSWTNTATGIVSHIIRDIEEEHN